MGFSSFKTKAGQLPYLITVLVFLWTALAHAAGLETQVRNTGYFTQLHFDGAYTIFLSQGDSCSVKVEVEPKILAKLTTEVKNGTLKVDTKDSGWFCSWGHSRKDVKVYITVKALKSIAIDGSADLTGKGNFVCDTLELSISGSGDINLETESKILETGIAGSGDCQVNVSQELEISIAGSGEVAYKGNPAKVKNSISGSGEVNKVE